MTLQRTVSQALAHGKKTLALLEDGAFDAALLLEKATGLDKKGRLLEGERLLTPEESAAYDCLLEKRKNGMPTQYLLGEWEFMGLPFAVDGRVLIPRPDTELLVEETLALRPALAMDIGTGSGCIAVGLARLGNCRVLAGDISADALTVAKSNAEKNGVSSYIMFCHGDLFSAFPEEYRGTLDAVVSNPPYIASDVMPTLMREVRDHEPALALDGGKAGMEIYERLVPEAWHWLKDGGSLLLEIGYDQGALVKTLLEETGFSQVRVLQALDGLDRVVLGKKE